MAELRPPNRVPRRIRQEAASNGCAGISGTGKRRPPSTMGAIDWRRRAAGFYSRRCAQPRGFLSVLLDEFSSHSRLDRLLVWALDFSAPDQRPLGPLSSPVRFKMLAGPGIILYVFVMSFAAIDWAMSLSPHWASTIYGFLFVAGQLISSMSFMIAVVVLLARSEPFASVLQKRHLHDLGKLLLAFVMLWA